MSAENAWRIAREILATMPTKYLARCPMPPAFRAAVEAETEELRTALKRAIENQKCLIWRLEELCNNLGPGDEQYDICEHVKECLAEDSALLSRLEAKGESHE